MFQFRKVQLIQGERNGNESASTRFQFRKVQLIPGTADKGHPVGAVSIPQGPINTSLDTKVL